MLTRRTFLQASSLAMGASSLAPLGALAADQSGYKALVCIFLAGGCDTHDVLIGYDPSSYDQWASVRRSLLDQYANTAHPTARARESLLPLNPVNQSDFGTRQFAMPPEMGALKSLFDQGQLAFVPNVGPLIEPVSQQQVHDKVAPLPARLRSHNDQKSTWEALGVEGADVGWGGLVLDAVAQSSPYAAISTSGQSVFLAGQGTTQLQISNSQRVETAWGADGPQFGSENLGERIRGWYQQQADGFDSPLMRDYMRVQAAAVRDTNYLSEALQGVTLGNSVRIAGNSLSDQLATIADLISVRGELGINRQVFFAKIGGFDSHSNQAHGLPLRLAEVSDAMASFHAAMQSAGLANDVTTFTASDFGRTLQSNATGTDHGWGSHHMVMGGAVRGNRIHGEVPSFELGHERDWKRGILIPDLAVEQYGAELSRWFGLSETELNAVFARRQNFDTTALQLF